MFCPHCGKESLVEANFCSACGTPRLAPTTAGPRIVRPRHPRMLAGVCAGFAIHYGWKVATVRILFAIFTCLTSGAGVLVYLALWILLPGCPLRPSPHQLRPKLPHLKSRARAMIKVRANPTKSPPLQLQKPCSQLR